MTKIVETFRTKSGRKRSIKLDTQGQQYLERIEANAGIKPSMTLQRLSACLPPALKGGTWTKAMRDGLQRWAETGETPQSLRAKQRSSSLRTNSMQQSTVAGGSPTLVVRDMSLVWRPDLDRESGCLWRFSVRVSIAPTNNERIAIVGDDCFVQIYAADGTAHELRMLLRNIQVNRGPVEERVDLDTAADLYFVAQDGCGPWAEPKPTRLRGTVELVAVMHRWTKSVPVELIWSPNADYVVRWAGYGEAGPVPSISPAILAV